MRKQKSESSEMTKIWIKNPKKWQQLGTIKPEFSQKLIVRHPEMRPRQFKGVCISCLDNSLLRD